MSTAAARATTAAAGASSRGWWLGLAEAGKSQEAERRECIARSGLLSRGKASASLDEHREESLSNGGKGHQIWEDLEEVDRVDHISTAAVVASLEDGFCRRLR